MKPWTCTRCKKPIAADEGYVVIMDAETGGYPQRPTPDGLSLTKEAAESRTREGRTTIPPLGFVRPDEVELPPRQIKIDVLHCECDPDPDGNAYWIGVEHAAALESWCAWVHHLADKRWIGKRDMEALLSLWFENRGENVETFVGG